MNSGMNKLTQKKKVVIGVSFVGGLALVIVLLFVVLKNNDIHNNSLMDNQKETGNDVIETSAPGSADSFQETGDDGGMNRVGGIRSANKTNNEVFPSTTTPPGVRQSNTGNEKEETSGKATLENNNAEGFKSEKPIVNPPASKEVKERGTEEGIATIKPSTVGISKTKKVVAVIGKKQLEGHEFYQLAEQISKLSDMESINARIKPLQPEYNGYTHYFNEKECFPFSIIEDAIDSADTLESINKLSQLCLLIVRLYFLQIEKHNGECTTSTPKRFPTQDEQGREFRKVPFVECKDCDEKFQQFWHVEICLSRCLKRQLELRLPFKVPLDTINKSAKYWDEHTSYRYTTLLKMLVEYAPESIPAINWYITALEALRIYLMGLNNNLGNKKGLRIEDDYEKIRKYVNALQSIEGSKDVDKVKDIYDVNSKFLVQVFGKKWEAALKSATDEAVQQVSLLSDVIKTQERCTQVIQATRDMAYAAAHLFNSTIATPEEKAAYKHSRIVLQALGKSLTRSKVVLKPDARLDFDNFLTVMDSAFQKRDKRVFEEAISDYFNVDEKVTTFKWHPIRNYLWETLQHEYFYGYLISRIEGVEDVNSKDLAAMISYYMYYSSFFTIVSTFKVTVTTPPPSSGPLQSS